MAMKQMVDERKPDAGRDHSPAAAAKPPKSWRMSAADPPILTVAETLPKSFLLAVRTRGDRPALREKVLGIWKTGGVASPKDPVDGYMWLLLAERQGDTNAGKVRLRAAEKMSPADIRKAEAAADSFQPKPERPLTRPDDEAPPLKPMAPRP